MRAIWIPALFTLLLCFACSSSNITDEEVARIERQLNSILQESGKGVPYILEAIRSHPRKEINTDLRKWIESGKAAIEYNPEFEDRVPASTGLRNVNGTLIPVLGVGDMFFTFGVKQKFIALSHEYQHVKEVIEGTANLDWYQAESTEKTVRDYFEEEARAYISHCKFAHEIDATIFHAACVEYQLNGELAFRRGLANVLSQETRFSGYRNILFSQAERGYREK